jgi:hypothetical protein
MQNNQNNTLTQFIKFRKLIYLYKIHCMKEEFKKMQQMQKLVNSIREDEQIMKSIINEIKEEKSTLIACIKCKKYLNSQRYGLLLENHIKNKFGIDKYKQKNNKTIEIKVSLSNMNGDFNIKQIRPDDRIHYYLILYYQLNPTDELNKLGKTYWFLIPSLELYNLLPEYGSYMHGTTKKLGKMNEHNIYGRNIEYALSPNSIKRDTCKSKKLWNILCRKYMINDDNIMNKMVNLQ